MFCQTETTTMYFLVAFFMSKGGCDKQCAEGTIVGMASLASIKGGRDINTTESRTYITANRAFVSQCCGVVKSWSITMATKAESYPAPIYFQVWRPVGQNATIQLVGQTQFYLDRYRGNVIKTRFIPENPHRPYGGTVGSHAASYRRSSRQVGPRPSLATGNSRYRRGARASSSPGRRGHHGRARSALTRTNGFSRMAVGSDDFIHDYQYEYPLDYYNDDDVTGWRGRGGDDESDYEKDDDEEDEAEEDDDEEDQFGDDWDDDEDDKGNDGDDESRFGVVSFSVPERHRVAIRQSDVIGWQTPRGDMVSYTPRYYNLDNFVLPGMGKLKVGSTYASARRLTSHRTYAIRAQLTSGTAPAMTNLPSSVTVSRHLTHGHVIFIVTVYDPDLGDVTAFSLPHQDADDGSPFHINPATGAVTVLKPLQEEKYDLFILVLDSCGLHDFGILNVRLVANEQDYEFQENIGENRMRELESSTDNDDDDTLQDDKTGDNGAATITVVRNKTTAASTIPEEGSTNILSNSSMRDLSVHSDHKIPAENGQPMFGLIRTTTGPTLPLDKITLASQPMRTVGEAEKPNLQTQNLPHFDAASETPHMRPESQDDDDDLSTGVPEIAETHSKETIKFNVEGITLGTEIAKDNNASQAAATSENVTHVVTTTTKAPQMQQSSRDSTDSRENANDLSLTVAPSMRTFTGLQTPKFLLSTPHRRGEAEPGERQPTNAHHSAERYAIVVTEDELDLPITLPPIITSQQHLSSFYLTGGSGRDDFRMDPVTGSLLFQGSYDFDDPGINSTLTLEISARKRSRRKWAGILEVTVLDVNDNAPEVTSSLITLIISKTRKIGDVIGQIHASDRDKGENARLKFEVVSSSVANDVFGVLEDGAIVVRRNLAAEADKEAQLRVVVSDCGHPPLSTTVAVFIVIQ